MTDIIKVYNLFYVAAPTNQGIGSRPTVANFSSMKKLQKHVVELVLKCDKLDPGYRATLEFHAKSIGEWAQPSHWELFIKNFRVIQLENTKFLGFDIWWDEEPQVLL